MSYILILVLSVTVIIFITHFYICYISVCNYELNCLFCFIIINHLTVSFKFLLTINAGTQNLNGQLVTFTKDVENDLISLRRVHFNVDLGNVYFVYLF